MNTHEIIIECNKIFIEQFDNSNILLKMDTTAEDIEEWDSLTHIQIIVAIENFFKVRFTASEIKNFMNVGEMCNCIEKKLATKE